MTAAQRLARLALAIGAGSRADGLLAAAGGDAEAALAAALAAGPPLAPPLRGIGDVPAVLARLRAVVRAMCRRGERALLRGEEGYPRALARLPHPPPVLFAAGRPPEDGALAAAVVGARAATARAVRAARATGAALARAGVAVVSGGAIGIDGAAHEGALAGAGHTVAVLGSGLDRPYPERHVPLFARLRREGGLLSPHAPGIPPRAGHFPRRNAIVAALAGAVVVVEAGARSGALGTARHARALGVPVLAFPGSPGCDRLLREGAGVATRPEDVLGVLGGGPLRRCTAGEGDRLERDVLALLTARPRGVAAVARALGVSPGRAAALLVDLEVAGRVRGMPGGRYGAI